jgi:hypothetical protein
MIPPARPTLHTTAHPQLLLLAPGPGEPIVRCRSRSRRNRNNKTTSSSGGGGEVRGRGGGFTPLPLLSSASRRLVQASAHALVRSPITENPRLRSSATASAPAAAALSAKASASAAATAATATARYAAPRAALDPNAQTRRKPLGPAGTERRQAPPSTPASSTGHIASGVLPVVRCRCVIAGHHTPPVMSTLSSGASALPATTPRRS